MARTRNPFGRVTKVGAGNEDIGSDMGGERKVVEWWNTTKTTMDGR